MIIKLSKCKVINVGRPRHNVLLLFFPCALLPVHQIVSMIWFSMFFNKSMDTNCVLIVSNTSSPRLNLQYCTKEIKAKFADFRSLFRENSKKIRLEISLKCPRIFVESNGNWLLSWRNFAFIEANFVLPKFRPEILKYWWSMKFGESLPLFGNMESPFFNYY